MVLLLLDVLSVVLLKLVKMLKSSVDAEDLKSTVTGVEMFRKFLTKLKLVITSVLYYVVFRGRNPTWTSIWLNQVQ